MNLDSLVSSGGCHQTDGSASLQMGHLPGNEDVRNGCGGVGVDRRDTSSATDN